MKKDKIYSSENYNEQQHSKVSDFCFNNEVAEVFPDMVNRSIPGYQNILNGLALIANHFAQNNSNIYDLGCSLGAVTKVIRSALENTNLNNINFIAIDNSSAMIERAKLMLSAYNSRFDTQICLNNVLDHQINNASIVILNFILQFIEPTKRYTLLSNIYNGLNEGGAIILSEKIKYENQDINKLIIKLHHDFKLQNGYSKLEVQRKRDALENVMILSSIEEYKENLKKIGFKNIVVWQQQFNFCSLLAIK